MESYLFNKQLFPPTGVEHCIRAKLIDDNAVNLVIAKTSLLQVYTIRYDRIEQQQQQQQQTNEQQSQQDTLKPWLELNLELQLFSIIESLNCVRLPGDDIDSLILSFRDAKVSIVKYNKATEKLDIRSLHYFEGNSELKGGRKTFRTPPLIRVDYQQRCAVMLLYDRHLAVLPFPRSFSILDDEEEEEEEEAAVVADQQQQHDENEQQQPQDDQQQQQTSEKNKKKKQSESYVISLNSLGIENVKDFCFLHTYYEPTLLFLHEPSQTWTSRISSKKFTNVLTAVSLNIAQRQQPVIWSIEHLPYNCERLVPVPDPLGGAMVLTPNILFYFNQSSRYGLECNEYAQIDTGDQFQFPIDSSSTNLVFTLDCANFIFLGDRLLGSLKGGELLIFHLISDGRNVQRISITKAGASVLSSTSCVLTDNLLFLGSRLGDSLLLQYTEKIIDVDSSDNVENLSNPYKKKKTSEVFDLFDDEERNSKTGASDADGNGQSLFDDEDDIFNDKKNQLKSYRLNICDHITNIGPVSDLITGVSYDHASVSNDESFEQRSLELVACSGHGKNGALTILQYGVRPELNTSFELPGVRQSWTLYYDDPLAASQSGSSASNAAASAASKKRQHEEDSTLVFQTGGQLKEVAKFDHATITVANMFGRRRIALVHQNGIKLLSGHSNITQEIKLKSVKMAYIVDPYVLILHKDGTISLYQGNTGITQLLEYELPQPKDGVMSCSMFHDVKSFFSINNNSHTEQSNNNSSSSTFNFDTDDEDDKDGDVKMNDKDQSSSSTSTSSSSTTLQQQNVYLIILTKKSTMELYRLDTKELIISAANVSKEYDILGVASHQFTMNQQQLLAQQTQHHNINNNTNGNGVNQQQETQPKIVEIVIHYLHNSPHSSPYLMILNEFGDILIYKAIKYKDSMDNTKELIRFIKHTDQNLHSKQREYSYGIDPSSESSFYIRKIVAFDNIGGHKGVFMCGKRSLWFFCEKNYLRAHPMNFKDPVTSFTCFHNINCSYGFIYFTEKGVLRINQLSNMMNFENEWAIRKIPLRMTCHKISFHQEFKCYVLVISYPQAPQSDEEEEEKEKSKKPLILEEKFQVKLIDPSMNWSIVDSFSMSEKETVLCAKIVHLKYADVDGIKLKPYLCVGTAYTHGEDTVCKGRILVFEIISHREVQDDTGEEKKRLNLLYEKDQKGPVTALAGLNGLLLMSIGPKLIVNNFSSGSLVGIAFYDTQIFIVSLSTVKNYILVGDMYKSVSFFKLKDQKQLILLGKDYEEMNTFSNQVHFLVHNGGKVETGDVSVGLVGHEEGTTVVTSWGDEWDVDGGLESEWTSGNWAANNRADIVVEGWETSPGTGNVSTDEVDGGTLSDDWGIWGESQCSDVKGGVNVSWTVRPDVGVNQTQAQET
ncbi:CPSF domain-containing protein [Heterostelium album PN500]|uniref:CPSF domain-containing protein n=1 Tax=Heterostelium pallidum (strain ATCC 26659 / Pp 5 / PN500) TaxID=670386 RepID=D3BH79_HETP5|nr:CPSF domain-containing protein [Heterostelium album PN500]EFA79463.1 CPSF domain-containing protein [Heterostelium album PN500]|eukprot:XP_020431584.1 CPSF domain-containing protein [Heterostelium album PN500]